MINIYVSAFLISSLATDATERSQPPDPVNLVIVRPFCNHDYHDLLESFNGWNEFHPCSKGDHNRYTLVLSYSRDLTHSDEIMSKLSHFVDKFKEKSERWHHCFSSVTLHSARVPLSLDHYRPDEYYTDPDWVSGPNSQFIEISRWLDYHHSGALWFLMEGDTRPVKEHWLTTLAHEIESEAPFAILGSIYRGDKWDQMLEKINPALKYHINGNAVYNLSLIHI